MARNHAEYILLAEFDIDKGASLTHQYPRPVPTDEHLLAELMLPDGAHLRENDWTIFFLNQEVPPSNLAELPYTDPDNDEDNPILYVLNLVQTRHDREARRGAMVKAMAICTRHRFLDQYKHILFLALENYFSSPNVDVLANLFEAVNTMDLSFMPNLSNHEKLILRFSEANNMFEEKFIEADVAEITGLKEDMRLSRVGTSQSEIEAEARKRHRRKTYIDLSSGQRKDNITSKNKDRHCYETEVFYQSIKISIKIPLTIYREEVGEFFMNKLITTFANGQISSPRPLHPHLDSGSPQPHPLILLINALLTQKRIIFLGHGRPSGEVANYVLAACALGSGSGGVLRGFTNRAFPYTNLTSLDQLLEFPGFIAGVTNPTFEEHPHWWDVLCNVNTGKITVSPLLTNPALASAPIQDLRKSVEVTITQSKSLSVTGGKKDAHADKYGSVDAEFIMDLMSAIERHYGELTIRTKIQNYIRRFVLLCGLYEYQTSGNSDIGYTAQSFEAASPNSPVQPLGFGLFFPDSDAKLRELALNKGRIEGFIGTIAYEYLKRDTQTFLEHRAIRSFDLEHQLAKLRDARFHISDEETELIFRAMADEIITEEQYTYIFLIC
ncbi:docking domain of Afi1 for Arf3 in vesicle trafficking-domain-containing protein [Dimargaris cristalligena]|uniref:Docking domain of Afi1 for Arf3 in vesicle trafficking-domain-containing protein n=1 Tax=Dimargaris cristalligena TaxID=215637 RepID=A0A4P9ZQW4_9FUNG|nr:docking domain of Afi1 for Arf3 in vesicle trafficking-domain-containing protein [Dimargaris cristalligena]|eukprot:RKP35528.1 docking domain of Afi1 for Arf3 in vesicle trafficking-domain-containing protein [Dimargaris cristalligena]